MDFEVEAETDGDDPAFVSFFGATAGLALDVEVDEEEKEGGPPPVWIVLLGRRAEVGLGGGGRGKVVPLEDAGELEV